MKTRGRKGFGEFKKLKVQSSGNDVGRGVVTGDQTEENKGVAK